MTSIGLVFGSFDGIHEGHKQLLQFAKSQVKELHAALATDETIRELKGVHPAYTFNERKESLLQTGFIISVSPSQTGDEYACIQALHPSHIILGYDQNTLKEHLLKWLKKHKMNPSILTAPAHHPDRFKTSLLYDRHQINP